MSEELKRTYDVVADDYAEHIFDELKDKPFDRQLLDELTARAGAGVICDLGCGPGHVARYLHERGANVIGVDLSPGMIERARALTPSVPFEVGDMRALDVPDGAWQVIVAFYSIIHIAPQSLPEVFGEMKRVLAPGGTVLLSFHMGSEVLHRNEWWGHAVSADFFFLQRDEVTAALESGGFVIERVMERDPYPEVEYASRRAYVFATKPLP
jgi:SAM-dependent methyltransferase